MGEINEKRLEEAIRLMTAPLEATMPMLQALEIILKTKTIYLMGIEDGIRQQDGANIIKSTDGGD